MEQNEECEPVAMIERSVGTTSVVTIGEARETQVTSLSCTLPLVGSTAEADGGQDSNANHVSKASYHMKR